MEDDDIQVSSDGEDAGDDDVGGNAQVAGLPPYVDAIIQGYSRQYGRVIGRKLVRAKDPAKDRDRLVVTYEDGAGKRKAVTFKIGKEGTPADPSIKDDTGTPAETTIVESVEDVKTPAKPAARQTVVRGADGKNHIMEADATGAYTIDRGLAPNQPTPEKPAPSEAAKWQPLKGPDGKVVALLDPATGETVNVTQKDPQKPDVFQTKDGRIITVSPDGTTAKDVTPEGPGDKPVPAGLEYQPDYDQDDGGLTAYNDRLMEARRAGIINRQQGLALLQQAGAIWETTATHGAKRRDQANTERTASISQRGQSLGEVQSRRNSADDQYKTVGGMVDKLAEGLIPSDGVSGQTIVDAYRAMLSSARENVDAVGGYRDVPEIAPVSGRPMGTDSTQIIMHPGGRIEVSPAGADPLPAVAAGVTATNAAAADPSYGNVQAATDATIQGTNAAIEPLLKPPPPYNPPAGEPGHNPTGGPVGLFDPGEHASVLAEMGFDDDEAQNVLALYRRGVRADQL